MKLTVELRDDDQLRLRGLPRLLLDAVRLVRTAAPRTFALVMSASLLQSLLAGLQVLLAKTAIERLLTARGDSVTGRGVLVPLVALAVLSGVTTALTSVQSQKTRQLAERAQQQVQRDLMRTCSGIDLLAYENAAFYNRLQRVTANALSRPVTVTQGLLALVSGLVSSTVLAVAVLQLAPALVPLLLLAGLPLAYLSRRGSRSEFTFQRDQIESARERFYLQDVLSAREPAKEVRAFGLSDVLIGRWESRYSCYFDDLQKQVSYRQRLGLLAAAVTGTSAVAAIAVVVLLLRRYHLSLASAGAAAVAARLLSSQVAGLVAGAAALYESGLFLQDLASFLALTPTMVKDDASGRAVPPFTSITARGVSFTYPGASRPALAGVDLDVQRGEVIALVGENGSGKTTLAKILAGLYPPTSGRVDWDGIDTATLDLAELRKNVAVIFQDFVHYQLPAQQNIGVGRAEAIDDREAVEAAARQSGADAFLSALPHGYDTYLSRQFSNGQELSLGQWQRVALARAFYREAPFIILDEPSSALDPRAEHDLFLRLRQLLADRTVVFISHRFSSVRTADRIYVMDEGRVVETGSHDELMAADGLYAELFSLQAQAFGLTTPAGPT